MLVHFVKPEWSDEYDGFDYDKYHIISTMQIKDYQRFIKFLDSMKEQQVEYQGEWYTIDSYVFVAPQDSNFLPCIRVYVYEYIA